MTATKRILESPVVWQGKYVRVELTRYLNRLGQILPYETVRRMARGEIVAVLAVTEKREVVLTKSFRVPHGHKLDYCIEFPAGLADKGVDSAELARLELLEETGYAPGTPLTRLMAGPFDAGMNDDTLAYYFTAGARKVAEQALEPAEDIEVLTVPLDGLEDFLLANQPHCDIKMLGPVAMARHLKLL